MTVSLFFSLASFTLCVLFCLLAGVYLRRRTGQERILAEFREEVYKLVAVIDAATDKDALLVEDRIKSLRALLEEADKRMGVYTREMDRRRAQEKAYAELGKTHITPFPRENSSGGKGAEDKKEPGLQKTEPMEPPGAGEGEPAPGPRFVQASRKIEPKPPPIAEQVTKLARAGFSPNIIAARLGITISEVELILAISKL
ncbi:MAG: hypothetical protein LBT93_07290 [Treponema sp.]|jgi:hypothetical protein|nr:hypothetical protein [Treponema sp.]